MILSLCAAGMLWVSAPLDFELCREYYLSVEGARGKASLADIAMVIINITDINDNPPVFSRGDYSSDIAENISPGNTVMQVSLTVCLTRHCRFNDKAINCGQDRPLPVPTYPLFPPQLWTVTLRFSQTHGGITSHLIFTPKS